MEDEPVPETNKIIQAAVSCTDEISFVPSTFSLKQFHRKFIDRVVFFQLLNMKDSFILWIGSSPAQLNNLEVAMNSTLVRFFFFFLVLSLCCSNNDDSICYFKIFYLLELFISHAQGRCASSHESSRFFSGGKRPPVSAAPRFVFIPLLFVTQPLSRWTDLNIAKRTNKQIFLSYNLPKDDHLLHSFVEKCVLEVLREMKDGDLS